MTYLLAVDAGTTAVKAAIFAPSGACVGIGRQEYQLDTPSADRAQLDPEIYWRACVDTIHDALQQSGAKRDEVRALAVSSQGETTITLDASGRAILPAIVWLDNRAAEQAAYLAGRFAGFVYERTGIPEILPMWPAAKIMWIRQNEPEVFARAAKFVLVQDYLIFRLTGRIVTDGSISCTSLNYDIRTNRWWGDVLDTIGIASEQLPEIVDPGTAVGTLHSEVASQLGLSPRTAVVTGGMDQCVGAIGAGNFEPGVVSETTGAALAVQATIVNPLMDASRSVPVYLHSVPGKYLFAPIGPTAGMAFKWLRDTFFHDETQKAEEAHADTYDRLTQLALPIPAGADGLVMLPHLMGAFSPVPNSLARGSFTGFTLGHTRAHFVRAVLEGVAFLLRQNLDLIERAGVKIHEIRSTGGGARSPLWNQIKADVCNRPIVTLQNEETALLGDSILAGVACGVFSSIAEGCRAMVATKARVNPGSSVGIYADAYRRYCDLDRTLYEYFRQNYAVSGETH